MTPSHVRKGGIKYRYYLSSSLLHGQPERAGSVRRVPAAEVEALVASVVRGYLGDSTERDDRDLIRNHVVRVEVQAGQLAVELKPLASGDSPAEVADDRLVLRVPWKKTPMKRRREIMAPASEFATRSSADPRRDPRYTCRIHRAWSALARRDHYQHRHKCGSDCRARKMQRSPSQYDDLARVPLA
jgi:site-specific DNA recombinase